MTSSRPSRDGGARSSPASPSTWDGPATGCTSRRCSSTTRCSRVSASRPTSSRRRCTSSRTAAAAVWRCAPKGPAQSCAPTSSTVRRHRGRSGTSRRTSVPRHRKPVGTASTSRSASRRSARWIQISTSKSLPCSTASSARSVCSGSACSSTRSATRNRGFAISTRCASTSRIAAVISASRPDRRCR